MSRVKAMWGDAQMVLACGLGSHCHPEGMVGPAGHISGNPLEALSMLPGLPFFLLL